MLNDAFTKATGATLRIQPQEWPLETKVLAAARQQLAKAGIRLAQALRDSFK